MTPLYGLVLAGGQGSRMGQDKGTLKFKGQSSIKYQYEMLFNICDRVFVSRRKDQELPEDCLGIPVLTDISSTGPLSGIMRAFFEYKDVNWLVTACDMPGLQTKYLQKLINDLREEDYALCARGVKGVEPLCAIYNTKIFPKLEARWNKGEYSLKKLLISLDCRQIQLDDQDLSSLNTPEDLENYYDKNS